MTAKIGIFVLWGEHLEIFVLKKYQNEFKNSGLAAIDNFISAEVGICERKVCSLRRFFVTKKWLGLQDFWQVQFIFRAYLGNTLYIDR